MAEQRPRRAGPLWAWLLAVLLVIIAITLVLDQMGGDDAAVERPAAAELGGEDAAPEAAGPIVPLDALTPLTPGDAGARVRYDGRITAVVAGGAWIETSSGRLVFLRLPEEDAAALAPGRRVAGTGVVRYDAKGRIRTWQEEAELSPAERSERIGEFYIETTVRRLGRR